MQFTQEHEEIRRNLKRFIDNEVNPHVDEWEAAEQFPAHEVFKKLGNLGLLGLTKPEAYGGAGIRVDKKEDVEKAIRWAKSITDRPCVLDFVVAAEENVYPMIPAGRSFEEIIDMA
jgi:alkylation response protein AidB-like acyl-CoA dehydrogenase